MASERPVTVVVNTNGRAPSLPRTLSGLDALDHRETEVIVVAGPDQEGLADAIAPWRDRIVLVGCPERNLSRSRNIGIRAAAGAFVAFIDDDAVPDPGWLTALLAGFEGEDVAATGGPVFDHTGGSFQAWDSFCTRAGVVSSRRLPGPASSEVLGSPSSWRLPTTMGTNACFRRDALVEIGGFDEEFDYYLDETDVCVRLIDQGYRVRLLENGFVYHQFLPSDVRNDHRVVRDWSSILKNVCYFGAKHGAPIVGITPVGHDIAEWCAEQRVRVGQWAASGLVAPDAAERFDESLARDGDRGWRRALLGTPRVRDPEWFSSERRFLPFVIRRSPRQRLHLCLIARSFEASPPGGIARLMHAVATGLTERGHLVRVIAEGDGRLQVDREDAGYWIHRVPPSDEPVPAPYAAVPQAWAFSAAAHREVERIDGMRPVDVVQMPNWDSEGVLLLDDGRWPTSLGLYTPLRAVAVSDDRVDEEQPAIRALIGMEERSLVGATRLLACGPGIVREIEDLYGCDLPEARVSLVPHGLPDAYAHRPRPAHDDVLFVFVGRLEPRKGVVPLLEAFRMLAGQVPSVRLELLGPDTFAGSGGEPYETRFRVAGGDDRVTFRGAVEEADLLDAYGRADVVVVPSLFESFGLVAVEAMMHGAPVIASDVGGLAEIVVDGRTGLLVAPDDVDALRAAMVSLATDGDLRRRLGRAGRLRYEAEYSAAVMAERLESHYLEMCRAPCD